MNMQHTRVSRSAQAESPAVPLSATVPVDVTAAPLRPVKPLLSLCAPAYNEEEAIERVVRGWMAWIEREALDAEIVITNDGSTDRTGEILARLATELPRLVVVTHRRNGGYGQAMRTALAQARGDYLITLDGDGQSDPDDWREMRAAMLARGLDVVTGYRHAKQADRVHVGADRALNLLIRLMFGLTLRDTNCTIKLFKREVGHELAALGEAMGYAAPTEFLVKARLLGYRVGEVGTTHLERAGGVTKLKVIRTSLDMARFLLYLRLKQYLFKRRIIARL